ncbi:hypothetical protein DFS34DRAFT_72719 [Phlyctochytrium arcticum]|nr:hypothetical protein DFS34DRAFT_72719 [Phlyctochytrium arcticum]
MSSNNLNYVWVSCPSVYAHARARTVQRSNMTIHRPWGVYLSSVATTVLPSASSATSPRCSWFQRGIYPPAFDPHGRTRNAGWPSSTSTTSICVPQSMPKSGLSHPHSPQSIIRSTVSNRKPFAIRKSRTMFCFANLILLKNYDVAVSIARLDLFGCPVGYILARLTLHMGFCSGAPPEHEVNSLGPEIRLPASVVREIPYQSLPDKSVAHTDTTVKAQMVQHSGFHHGGH